MAGVVCHSISNATIAMLNSALTKVSRHLCSSARSAMAMICRVLQVLSLCAPVGRILIPRWLMCALASSEHYLVFNKVKHSAA